MPTLRKYKTSSPKDGYYIQANVGAAHPITLQVTNTAEMIFDKTGYHPDQSVPTKLVWSMYDLELLFTEKSIESHRPQNVSISDVFQDLNLKNRLSAREVNKVISYLDDYNGPQQGTLTKLKIDLESATPPDTSDGLLSDGTGKSQSVGIPQTTDEAIAFLFPLCSDVSDFRQIKNSVNNEYLLRSLQTFLEHPHVKPAKSDLDSAGNLRYHLARDDRDYAVRLTDQRRPQKESIAPEADYLLRISTASGAARAAVADEDVISFTAAEGGGYDRHQLMSDLSWILPKNPRQINSDNGEKPAATDLEREIEAPQVPQKTEEPTIHRVEVDRISTAGNPVIRVDGTEHLLNMGEPGEVYLAEDTGGLTWRALWKQVG